MGTNARPVEFDGVKAIFFDFGDTLASMVPSKEELFLQAAISAQLELDLEQVKRAYRIVDFHNKYSSVSITDFSTRQTFYKNYNEELCKAIGISNYFQALYPFLASHFERQKQWRLLNGAFEILNCLNERRIPLAVVANWNRDLSDLTECFGIRKFFACVISSQEAGIEKPDPRIFQLPVDILSLSTESDRILYVGNEYEADVLGARAAGLTPVLIDRDGYYPYSDCLRFASISDWFHAFILR
jgi:putative hydrolase of the HAD superfamily